MKQHPHFLWRDLFRRSKRDETSIMDVLRDNVLFAGLSRAELAYLSKIVYERVYQPDEPIFRQNDRGFGMYVISKGRVAIKTHTADQEVQITILGQNSFFGELALVEPDNIRTASAVATERTVAIGFFKPDLTEILERKPEMGVKILFQLSTVLGRRLAETTEKISSMAKELEQRNESSKAL